MPVNEALPLSSNTNILDDVTPRLLSPFVVTKNNITGDTGGYTTITAALAAAELAVAGSTAIAVIYVKSGTYTENITLRDRVHLIGLGLPTVVGKVTVSEAKVGATQPVKVTNINLTNNGAATTLDISANAATLECIFEKCTITVDPGVDGIKVDDLGTGTLTVKFIDVIITAPRQLNPNPSLLITLDGTSVFSYNGGSVTYGYFSVTHATATSLTLFSNLVQCRVWLVTPALNAGTVRFNNCELEDNDLLLFAGSAYFTNAGGTLQFRNCSFTRRITANHEDFSSGNIECASCRMEGVGRVLTTTGSTIVGCYWSADTDATAVFEHDGALRLINNTIISTGTGTELVLMNGAVAAQLYMTGNIISHSQTALINEGVGATTTYFQSSANDGAATAPAGNYVYSGSTTIDAGVTTTAVTLV